MTAIALRFPAGQFHATPWGRHVNEGVPEWPPSPWRLLRTLVAVWKIRAPDLEEPAVRRVLEQLTAEPLFHLPRATTGHTRHYMRWYKKGPTDQTLIFDAFVCLSSREEVVVVWPEAELELADRDLLQRLLENFGFLGRSESWCEARLLDNQQASELTKREGFLNCRPVNGAAPQPNEETVRVLCADPATAFGDEHVKPTANKKGKSKKSARQHYDPAWNLCIETAQLHEEKWSDPPGSRWVTYVRPADCFDPPRRRPTRRTPSRPRIQVARYALDSTVLPLLTETLPLAEQARFKLMGVFGRLTKQNGVKGKSPVFSGKDAHGNKLTGHGHAYYLPTDEDGDGRLDHLTIVAEDGFGPFELEALDRLRTLKRSDDAPEVRLLLLGLGRREEFMPMPLRPSAQWVSATPFLVTRHPKKNGRKRDPQELLENPHAFIAYALREELARLIERRQWPFSIDQAHVEPLYDPPGVFRVQPKLWAAGATGPNLRPIQFKRFRRKRGDDGGRRWCGAFRIVFPEPAAGPMALGHSAHFGLGLFLPAAENQTATQQWEKRASAEDGSANSPSPH